MALFYASTFIALGVHLPFLPVWLAAKGLDAADHRRGAGAADDPAPVRDSDGDAGGRPPRRAARGHRGRRRWRRWSASARSALTAGTLAIAVVYALAATAFMLLFVLSDVYALRGLAPHRRAYGPVRLWGSAAFIVANLAAGYLFDIIAARDLIWLIVAAVALCVVAAWALPPLGARPRPARASDAAGACAAARSCRSSRSPPLRA